MIEQISRKLEKFHISIISSVHCEKCWFFFFNDYTCKLLGFFFFHPKNIINPSNFIYINEIK